MAPKLISKGKEKDGEECKSDRLKANWTIADKKLFLNLVIKEKVKGNRPRKAFNAVGCENIVKSFNGKTG